MYRSGGGFPATWSGWDAAALYVVKRGAVRGLFCLESSALVLSPCPAFLNRPRMAGDYVDANRYRDRFVLSCRRPAHDRHFNQCQRRMDALRQLVFPDQSHPIPSHPVKYIKLIHPGGRAGM